LKKPIAHIILLAFMLLVMFMLNLLLAGSISMNVNEWSADNYVFSHIRLPKAITALLCGVSLPVAGQILQVLFRNPLAGPYVLGISAASSFFVSLTLLFTGYIGYLESFFISRMATMGAAVIGSVLSTLVILVVAVRVNNNVILLVIGLMLGQIFGALQSFVEYFANDKSLKQFVLWGFGSLGNTSNNDLLLFSLSTAVLLAAIIFNIKPFQAFLLGQHYAESLGINFKKYRLIFILISASLTAVATAFCGPIAFVGLAVPIMSRLLFKTSNQLHHIMYCILLGGIVMLLCDTLSHTIYTGHLLPINSITTIIGSPFVIYLLFKSKNW